MPGAGARLLAVSSFFDTHRGGLEIVAGRLARELAGRGFQVTWLATDATPAPEVPPVRAVPVRAWNIAERRLGVPFPLPSPRALARLAGEVKACDVVLLHDGLYATSVAALIAARLHGKPVIIVQHIGAVPYRSPLLRGLMALANRLVARPMLAAADQVVFISAFVREFFAAVRFRRPPLLIFNGVDTEVFRPGEPAARGSTRERLGLPAHGPVALFVGRFVEKKGLHLLRRTAALRPDLTFAFAGWGVIDPTTWGLPNVRVFSGLQGESLAELYRVSDALVLPSRGEGFPLVIQEALACGLPVVCNTESCTADPAAAPLLRGVELGEHDAPGHPEAIAAALDAALAAPGDAAARLALVRERYAWSAVAERYASLIHQLVDAPAAAGPARAASPLEPAR